jgi:hypothetical protein
LPILSDVDEAKMGIAVEPVSENVTSLVDYDDVKI